MVKPPCKGLLMDRSLKLSLRTELSNYLCTSTVLVAPMFLLTFHPFLSKPLISEAKEVCLLSFSLSGSYLRHDLTIVSKPKFLLAVFISFLNPETRP